MKNFMRNILFSTMCYSLIFAPVAHAKKEVKAKDLGINLNELILPSEVKNLGKSSGSIYYSPTVKGKVLIPVHFWGEVKKSGLHFIPIETTFINAMSLAGGPGGTADLESVKISRLMENGKVKNYYFDLSDGGTDKDLTFKMEPDDTIFVKKSNYYADRSYYTSLVGVVATILSSILLYREVQNNN